MRSRISPRPRTGAGWVSARAGAALAALSLATLLGACSSAPAPPALRLLEAKDGVEVTLPDLGGSEPSRVDACEFRTYPSRGRIVRAQPLHQGEDRDTRLALLAPGGSRYAFRLVLPKEPALRVGLATLRAEAGPEASLRFTASVKKGAEAAQVVLDETLPASSRGWRDLEVRLPSGAGEEVLLELAVSAEPPSPIAWAAWSAPEIVSLKGRPEGYDVVLVSLDTLRADHLGCYGYERPTSPNIDRFAARSVVFTTAVSQSPWTRPAHRAMLSGLFPASSRGFHSLALPAVLWQAGYRTTALTGGGNVDHRFGFSLGFDVFQVQDWVRSAGILDGWLEASARRKDFLFLHTYETHDPYEHEDFTSGIDRGRIRGSFSKRDSDRFRNRLSDGEKAVIKALYDGDIAYVDRQVGAFLDKLERGGDLDRTIVILTSDHGEQFWEHGGWRHGQNMYDHQLLVPLIVYLPDSLRRSLVQKQGKPVPARIPDVVRLVDIYPTVLDLLGLPLDRPVQGRSLRALLEGGTLPALDAFAENTNIGDEKKALRSQQFKFVLSIPRGAKRSRGDTAEQVELYDLARDPREQSDLASTRPELVGALKQRLDSIRQGRDEGAPDDELPEDIPAELREQLEALGYVGK